MAEKWNERWHEQMRETMTRIDVLLDWVDRDVWEDVLEGWLAWEVGYGTAGVRGTHNILDTPIERIVLTPR